MKAIIQICVTLTLMFFAIPSDALPNLPSGQHPNTVVFHFQTRMGANTWSQDGDLSQQKKVILPNIFSSWECIRSPLSLSDDGKKYLGGFVCSMDDFRTSLVIVVSCSALSGQSDSDNQMMTLTSNGVGIGLEASCTSTK